MAASSRVGARAEIAVSLRRKSAIPSRRIRSLMPLATAKCSSKSGLRLDSLLELSAAFQAIIHETEDYREALDALLEKRSPSFNGR
jgi:hypothetical protein